MAKGIDKPSEKHTKRSVNGTNGHVTPSTEATKFKTEIVTDDQDLSDEGLYEDEDEDDDDGGSTFIPKQSLSDSQCTSRSLESILNLINGPYLDLDPDYQRDVVWADTRMSALIDSLIENYYVPPVIFNIEIIRSEQDNRTRYKRTCVDGKQRLSSVKAFMEGKIPCHDKNGNKWFYTEKVDAEGYPVRSSRLILPEIAKEQFRKKELVCYEFNQLSHEQEEDLFQRVQKGMQLSPAEKFRATRGPWQTFAIMYENDFPAVVNLSENRRSIGFRNVLTCFAQILEAEYPSTPSGIPVLRSSVAALEKFIKNKSALNDTTRAHLARVFRIFNDLVEDDPQVFQNNGYRTARRFAPIELVAVSVLISKHGIGRSMPMLKGDIRDLREFLRERNTDLRMNTKVWGDVWDYIDDLESRRGAADGSTVTKKPKPKGRQTRVSKRIAATELPSYVDDPETAPAVRVEKVPIPAVSDRALSSEIEEIPMPTTGNTATNGENDDEDDEDYVDPNLQSQAMLNRFMQGAKQAVQPAQQAAGPPKVTAPRPAAAPVATMGHQSRNGESSQSAKIGHEAALPAPPTRESATPATNIKRRAQLDLGVGSSGARALAAKKARLA
ncbi:MAG: hypothetical protein M1836_001958 [Candelina mexicana]|nr:MAG: hypothetical protein M1836_001958 [Candelina mexicana]